MSTTERSDLYYDPYDFEIDTDPYPHLAPDAGGGAALLEREVRVLRPSAASPTWRRASSSGRPTARPRARCSS